MTQDIQGDTVDRPTEEVEISVICPFYNEEQIIGQAIRSLLSRLKDRLHVSWELIVVNDGSADGSLEVAREVAESEDRLRVLTYEHNRGRGHALRTGIAQARGRILVTTEIDLSWGEDIVERLYQAMLENPDADLCIASPHMPGGTYKNVPAKRVFLSKFGNHVIRTCMSGAATMNTGMTRAYKRASILALPLEEDKKEFHLEVILKAEAFGYRFCEIPATLEWKDYKHQGQRVARKSSSKIKRLVVTHSLFSLLAKPTRWMWLLSFLCLLGSGGFLVAGVVRFFMDLVSVYMLIVSLALAIIAILLFAYGVITQQGNTIQKELWTLRSELARLREREAANDRSGEVTHNP